jgi:glycosyltransferase involved in cell wall biosynthesis
MRLGVNAIGSWSATTGLAEAARRTVNAMLDAGIAVSLVNVDLSAPVDARRLSPRLAALPTDRTHLVDVFTLNVNEFPALDGELLRPKDLNSYLIASWFWELPTMPPELAAQVNRVDEVWVASEFVAHAMLGHTNSPVLTMPVVVEPQCDRALSRATFGLPEHACVFLLVLDAHSTFARKNPLGLVTAFRRAFSPRERKDAVKLAIKCTNLERLDEARETLRGEVASVSGVLIEGELASEAVSSLISLCDVFVSLHRAEGFGLALAEAMYFGRPIIATAYSGNETFMTALNSFPVPYRLAPVRLSDLRFNPKMEHTYIPGALWAEPDLDVAAAWMRRAYENPSLVERAGRHAAKTIRSRYSRRTAGTAIRRRLEGLRRGG